MSEMAVERPASPPIPGELSETSLVLREGLSFDEWQEVGTTLQRIEKSVRWWIGDWIAYGEKNYGETYAQAIEATGRKVQDLMNMVYVSSRVEISSRNENLSWSHHQAVAPLETPQERTRWLEKAEREDWSVIELRDQLRLTRERTASGEAVSIPKCRQCGEECRTCKATLTPPKKGRH